MEKETININNTKLMMNENHSPPHNVPKKKKKGLLKMIKVAIFMLRRQSTTSKQTSLWKRIVSAVTSFQDNDQLIPLQEQQHHNHIKNIPPPPPPPLFTSISDGVRATTLNPTINSLPDNNNDMMNVNIPTAVTDSPSSPAGCKSQYASALNLQDLDRRGGGEFDGCTDDDMIEIYIDEDGDELIDARASEYIANFYEQMKLQRLKSDLLNNRIYIS